MCDGKIAINLIKICVLHRPLLNRQCASAACTFRAKKFSVQNDCTSIKKATEGPFPSAYKPQEVERGWYEWWHSKGFFMPDNQSSKGKTFSMVLPPPNVTGYLHLGHVLTCTIQDVLARWHRMLGESVVWVPGLDHAGIATQVLVERKLLHEEHLTRYDVGRKRFMQKAQTWKDHQAHVIVEQLKRLGLSLDWSRELYTMDAKQTAAVMEAFIHLFDAGLIYRDCALVNWSCILQSAISDVEVVHRHFEKRTFVEVPGHTEPVEFGALTDFAYKLCDTDDEVVVSTTRLETLLGDVAVAVHPHDPRYKNLQGAHVWNPFTMKKLPVIFDECVDMKLGTGALKLTPAHNTVDFEVARRHSLDIIPIIMEDGTLSENCAQFSGMKRFDARKSIHKALHQMNLLRGHKDHDMHVPFCSRSGDVVELLVKPQWFVKCKTMAEEAAAAVQDGRMGIEPRQFEKVWYDWLYNIRDWCVSRQLWWGHQVPVYHCKGAGEADGVWVAASSVEHARRKAAAQLHLSVDEAEKLSITQDEDVLDTWFSSALIPFSALGWPDQSLNFKKYYPLSIMETGHDILVFWVARMVMLGLQLTCQLPFERILLHGMLCDAHGRKMSKSLGNVVTPEDVIYGISAQELQKRNFKKLESGLLSRQEFEKATEGQKKLFPNGIPQCGADALRFTLASHNIKSTFINFDVSECHTNSLFCNKLWQASRFTLLSMEKLKSQQQYNLCLEEDSPIALGKYDRWILSRLAWLVQEVNQSLHSSDIHLATSALKTFIHTEFCDVYLEATKLCLKSQNDDPAVTATCQTLLNCLDTTLRCLSPFMPFLSEELYQRLPVHRAAESITLAPYPTSHQWGKWRDKVLENEVQTILEMVSAIRRLKGAYMQTVKKPVSYVVIKDEAKRNVAQEHAGVMAHLTRCEHVVVVDELPQAMRTSSVAETIRPDCVVYLQHEGPVTTAKEERASKVEKLSKELDRLLKMTASAGYKQKASPQIQSIHLTKIETLRTELKRIENLKPTS